MDDGINKTLQMKKGLSATALKYIAVVAMVIDHIAFAFVETTTPLGIAMHFIGRITGPVMFYFIVEGYYNTRNIYKYTNRMLTFAVISYLPFFYFYQGSLPTLQNFAPMGIIYTLWLGLLALRALHEIKNKALSYLAVAGIVFLSIFGDWQIFGVLYILIFNYFRGDYKKQAAGGLALIALMIAMDAAGGLVYVIVHLGQILPLVLLYFYNGERGGGGSFSKWFFYIIYPLHLLIIGLLKWGIAGWYIVISFGPFHN